MNKYPIAICDFETTGLDPRIHEIIEIGMLVVDQKTFEVIDQMDVRVKPEHLETASPRAMQVNGYNPKDWKDAWDLKVSMKILSSKAKGAIFCGQNVTFDWGFADEGFHKTGIVNLMDYHRIDIFTMSWMLLKDKIQYYNLKSVSEYLGVEPEPEPHCAFNGAVNAFQVLQKLIEINNGL